MIHLRYQIDTVDEAKGALRTGWVTGVVVTLFELATGLHVFLSQNPPASFGFRSWELFDAVLYGVLTFSVYRKRRLGAAGLLGLFLFDHVLRWMEGAGSLSLLWLVIALGFVQGLRGARAYHQMTSGAPEPSVLGRLFGSGRNE